MAGKIAEFMDNENSKVAGLMVAVYSWRYRTWSRFIHRFNYHHMPLSYPDDDIIAWCHWCGLRDKLQPSQSTLKKEKNDVL